jgi:hypothetical protein
VHLHWGVVERLLGDLPAPLLNEGRLPLVRHDGCDSADAIFTPRGVLVGSGVPPGQGSDACLTTRKHVKK